MTLPIDQDVGRFRKIVRGKVRENLRKYMSSDELIGRSGKGGVVKIPLPQIDLPRFKYGNRDKTGVGRGKGDPGDRVGGHDGDESGTGAGDKPGEHSIEVELSVEELAEILGDELELPRIQPKLSKQMLDSVVRYNSIRRSGPEALRHPKRTYLEALKRQISSGTYDFADPVIIPIPDDKRYRSWKIYPRPDNNVAIFYLMDVSGSMSAFKKKLVRMTCYWANLWIRAHYKNVVERYIIHDTDAQEVDYDTFYRLSTGGGTHLSSPLRLSTDIISVEYDPLEWNIYVYQFSDGENWGSDDPIAVQTLEKELLPVVNLYSYGQVSGFFYGQKFADTLKTIKDFDNIVISTMSSESDVPRVIKEFLGKGL